MVAAAEHAHRLSTVPPPAASPFMLGRGLLWLALSLAAAVAVAWIAVQIEAHFAPLGLFSLAVGAAVGGCAVALLWLCQLGHRPTAIVGTILVACAAVVAQHYWSFERYLNLRVPETEDQLKLRRAFPHLAEELVDPRPNSFQEFMTQRADAGRSILKFKLRGPWAWLSWSVDGFLVLASALTVMVLLVRRPYCVHCKSWYRTVRSGPLTPEATEQLAFLAGIGIPHPTGPARFRILSCRQACGPTALEMLWHGLRRGPVGSGPGQATKWLDRDARDRLVAFFDKLVSSSKV